MKADHLKPFQTTSETMRRAWQIRREVAAANGITPLEVKWGPCFEQANGRKAKMVDWTGSALTKGKVAWWTRINHLILSPECPVCLDAEEIAEKIGVKVSQVRTHLSVLVGWGFAANHHGFMSVVDARRPFANDFDSWERRERREANKARAAVQYTQPAQTYALALVYA